MAERKSGEMKQYTIDTNVLRYKANSKAEPSHKKAAKLFWKQVIQEIQDGEAVIGVPQEVIRELKIQSFTLSPKENEHISDLLELCQEVLPDLANINIEHKIREMSAYVRSEFTTAVDERKMEYPAVADSRILHAAYYSDSALVTSNIKELLLYPLLFDNRNRLYDLLNKEYVNIPTELYQEIHKDLFFKSLLSDFHGLNQAIEDNEQPDT
ncbi:DUF4411 family protein [Heyndrickxia acidiproducens]|uniref:DUF4411 family protein n=1 Tax=Heyndrickxia acidiproducens TaxID=1121084 RepID=UPI0003613CC3|nr:DUF4411 family protein [Heyndrickxia acidiproducens]